MIGSLIAPLLLGTFQAPQIGPAKIRALFVGVSSYSNGEKQPFHGDLDAQRMAHLFRFQLGIPAENVKILDQDKDVTKQRILEEIDNWLIGKAGKDDALVFYWSGNASSFQQENGQTLNAIVPIDYTVTPDGKSVVGSSLIFSKELRVRFNAAKKERGLKDLLWILDSSYSHNSIGGENRYSCLFESEVTPDSNASALESKTPDSFITISAGNESRLDLPTGLNGAREPIAPLAYSFQKLGNRLTTYMSYGDLESELRSVAMENREDRQPLIQATPETKEKTLFGGHATTRKTFYPVGLPVNKRSPFEVVPAALDLDPSLATIPVGQLAGIQPGMRFLISGPKLKSREFKVVKSFSQVAQLSSGGPIQASELQDAKATLVDGVGVPKFEIFIGEDSGLNAFNQNLLKTKLEANPFIRVLSDKLKVGKILVGSRDGYQITGTDFPYLASGDAALTVDAAYNYIWHHARADYVSSIEPQGTTLFKVEAEACPLTVIDSPFPKEIFSHSKPPPLLSPKDRFAVRVKVSLNKNSVASLLGDAQLPLPKKLFVHVLKVDAHGVVKQACNPIPLATNLIERGSWNYIGCQYEKINKGLVNFQKAREAPQDVAVFAADESPLARAALTLKVVVTDSAEDLSALASRKVEAAQSDFGRILGALGKETEPPLSRGKGKAIQDWALATLRFVSTSE